jgi:hypothetical protein
MRGTFIDDSRTAQNHGIAWHLRRPTILLSFDTMNRKTRAKAHTEMPVASSAPLFDAKQQSV